MRERFLRRLFFDAPAARRPDARPGWGKMMAQQMVEHLTGTFELSTGRAQTECPVPEAQRERLKTFLQDNRPTPHEFMNPVLGTGLPALRNADLTGAKAALRVEVERFLRQAETASGALHTNPVFGPLSAEEWSRAHCKHGYHHLPQFGLVGC